MGFNHIYLYDKNGLKSGYQWYWEVTNYYGYDDKTNSVFINSENGSINRDVYKSFALMAKESTTKPQNTGTNAAT
jgi:dipeptidyl-peptidase-4